MRARACVSMCVRVFVLCITLIHLDLVKLISSNATVASNPIIIIVLQLLYYTQFVHVEMWRECEFFGCVRSDNFVLQIFAFDQAKGGVVDVVVKAAEVIVTGFTTIGGQFRKKYFCVFRANFGRHLGQQFFSLNSEFWHMTYLA